MHIGMMITAASESSSFATAERIVLLGLERNWSFSIFFMDNGVYAIKRFTRLLTEKNHIKLIACAHNCEERELPIDEGVKSGSQADWARIVDEAERVMVFG
ncbi:sulfur relay (sulfurtransferase) complex TusBCD TusD component (DsrE family) [Bacillus pakistanensis]|uniref:Sulfur relay (Sulfurtransferase) complex TusBCD TusD component (DsrE family) n=1 Tax=Rossellomorea pakistanensis TaxID=992288 RepID=A0ABS2N6Q8_9BACI|nr:DsrE family protein [Bacillus pakistanensis]MBM7583537.1 sulfur relay (sulfurtransferase) complex TusBCD TusD component (DsrE family) [Bacillus pakistanensis]